MRVKGTEFAAAGRLTKGIKGINLGKDDSIIAVLPIRDSTDCLAIFTEYGLGKRMELSEFLAQGRGTRGTMVYKPTSTSGDLSCAILVADNDTVLIAGAPNSICVAGADISKQSRSAAGTQIIKGSKVLSASKV